MAPKAAAPAEAWETRRPAPDEDDDDGPEAVAAEVTVPEAAEVALPPAAVDAAAVGVEVMETVWPSSPAWSFSKFSPSRTSESLALATSRMTDELLHV